MTSTTTEYKFIPHELWNLDPVHKSYARLYCCDVLAMPTYSASPGQQFDAFAYKNHPIYRVDIMGLVVSVAEREKFFSYAVDDGTGVIQCCCWKPKSGQDVADIPHSTSADSELAASLFKRMEDADEELRTPYELGDLIHVRGRLKMFRGRIEVSASYYRRIQDPTFQTEMRRMEELPVLYQSVYDRPFILADDTRSRIAQQEEEQRLGLIREAHLVEEAQEKLLKLLEDKTIQNFYLNELETVKDLLDVVSKPCVEYQQSQTEGVPLNLARQIKSIFKSVVDKLEHDGKIFKSSTEHGLYQAVLGNSRLNERILEILRADCRQSKYEGGCHYMHVMDRLRNMSGYENLGPDAVKGALSWLESNSEVISTSPKNYMAIT